MIDLIDLIFDLLFLFYWLVETFWVYGAIALFLWGLFHVLLGTPADSVVVSPWRTESLDFDNIPGEEEQNATHQNK